MADKITRLERLRLEEQAEQDPGAKVERTRRRILWQLQEIDWGHMAGPDTHPLKEALAIADTLITGAEIAQQNELFREELARRGLVLTGEARSWPKQAAAARAATIERLAAILDAPLPLRN